MILIADSGSTSTDWVLVSGNGNERYRTDGINPFYQSTESIVEMLTAALPDMAKSIDSIYFYGAGCVGGDKNNVIKMALESIFEAQNIHINSDLLGAARALCGQNKGIACILGTGSNSCYYNGIEIEQNISPLGYIIGDEGSGANIGKTLVADVLKHQLSDEVCNLFWKDTSLTAADIIDRIYRKPYPNRFLASFCKFANANIHMPEIEKLIVNCFDAFIERNILQYKNATAPLPINFVGSVAFYFQNQLVKSLEKHNMQMGIVECEPIERLAKYHASL